MGISIHPSTDAVVEKTAEWPGFRDGVVMFHSEGLEQPQSLIQDTRTGKYYSINENAWRYLDLLIEHGDHARAAEAYRQRYGEALNKEHVRQLLEMLAGHGLLRGTGQAAPEMPCKSLWSKALQAYLFFRVPLIRPRAFLERYKHWAAWIMNARWLRVAFALMAVAAFWQLGIRWDSFVHHFNYLATPAGIQASLVSLALLKIGHEFSHAFVCTVLGQPVRQMGVAMVLAWPVLYTDTTDAWRLPPRDRLKIDAAGLVFESAVAVIALFLWGLTDDGLAHSILYYLAATALASTVLINLNPFMRYDGYYILSDLLGVENLQQRAFQRIRFLLRKRLFGWIEQDPEQLTPREKRIFLWYGIGAMIYRVFLTAVICALLLHVLDNLFGLALVMLEAHVMVLRPLLMEARFILAHRATMRRFKLATASLALALLAVVLIPWPRSITVAAIAEPAGTQTLYAAHDGRLVTDINAREPNIRLRNDDLEYEINDARIHIEELNKQIHSLSLTGEGGGNRRKLEVERREAKLRLESLEKELQDMTLKVPAFSHLVWRNRKISRGQWVSAGTPLARFREVDQRGSQARLYLPANVARDVEPGQTVIFHSNEYGIRLKLALTSVSPASANVLEDPLLASVYGGELPVQEDRGGLLLRDSYLQARAYSPDAGLDLQNVAGEAKVSLPARSLGSWALNIIRNTWHGKNWQ